MKRATIIELLPQKITDITYGRYAYRVFIRLPAI